MKATRHPRDYIVFPLDVPSMASARKYIDQLADHVGLFKVGLELFIRTGPEIIRYINGFGSARVFLDLKLHDIPATVSRAMAGIADLEVMFATVHCGENRDMLDAAVSGSKGRVGVLGVTVLTSVSGADLKAAGFQTAYAEDVPALVLKRAAEARAAGCAGVVCSGREVETIKSLMGKAFIAATPGIRPLWAAGESDDQKRVTTPADAVKCGADYLVIGRPIRDADDPRQAAVRIADDIGRVLPSAQYPTIVRNR